MSFPLSYERAALPFAGEAASLSSPGDLDPEVFRRCGIQLVEGIADYLAHLDAYPVLPTGTPGEILQQLPSCAPEQAEPLEQVVAEALSLLPATTTHWQAPGYLAYFAVTSSVPYPGQTAGSGTQPLAHALAIVPSCHRTGASNGGLGAATARFA